MALKRRSKQEATTKSTSTFTNLAEGEYEGRLVYVADLGLQKREYRGDVKEPCQKISLGIEIVDHPHETDEGPLPRYLWTKPFNIFGKMDDRSNEYKMYRVFDPSAEADTYADWDKQLDKPCNVVIKHFKKEDAVYDNIADLTPIPAKYQDGVAPSLITPFIGDADDPENPATAALYGLAKWTYDQRIEDDRDQEDAAPWNDVDEIPF